MSRSRNFWTYRKIFIHKKVGLKKLTFSELVKVHIGLALLSSVDGEVTLGSWMEGKMRNLGHASGDLEVSWVSEQASTG